MTFKNELPEGCPDESIQDIPGTQTFYRSTKNSPPQDIDFIPVWHTSRRVAHQECLQKGLSVSQELKDIQAVLKQFKKIGKYIYCGMIHYKVDGIVKMTPSQKNPSHRTWYPYKDTDEKAIFSQKV